jgi:hypothetical protein
MPSAPRGPAIALRATLRPPTIALARDVLHGAFSSVCSARGLLATK